MCQNKSHMHKNNVTIKTILSLLTCALHKGVGVLFFVSLVLHTFAHTGILVALVLAAVFVIGVFTVAGFLDSLACLFLHFLLHLGVSLDKVTHVDNVLGGSASASAASRVSLADDELYQVLGVEDTFFGVAIGVLTDLNKRRAGIVLDGVFRHPRGVILVLVGVFELTGLRQESLSSIGGGGDAEVRDHAFGRSIDSDKGQDGGSKQHGE